MAKNIVFFRKYFKTSGFVLEFLSFLKFILNRKQFNFMELQPEKPI